MTVRCLKTLVAAIACALVPAVMLAGAALAGGDPPQNQVDKHYGMTHSSNLVVPANAKLPITRKVTVGVNKSMLVELPVDLENVLVSSPEILDASLQSARQVYLLAKKPGEANAFFVGPDGQKVLFLEVSVTRDMSVLQDSLQRLLPGSKIKTEMVGETLVLSGSVMNAIDSNRAGDLAAKFVKSKEQVVNMLGTDMKEQVMLKVQVAEMQRDAIRRLGIDITKSTINAGSFTFQQVLKNAFPVTSPITAAAVGGGVLGSGLAAPGGALVGPGVAAGQAIQPTWQTPNGQNVTGLLQALERTGVLKTLAEPTLTAISGESAKFLAGGEFPIPVALDDNRLTVQWKPYGVKVDFKPVVLTEGKISLNILAEVSEITSEGGVNLVSIQLPGLKVRRAETTLELPSGGTLAMAGLLSDQVNSSVEGFPGLKNLPVLGALFRSNDFRKRETELVILVTPYIASHSQQEEFAKPTDGYMPESELKELFLGNINRVYGRGSDPANHRYRGDYGYIVEYPGLKG